MTYNGTSFNEKWVSRLTLDEFLKHPATQGLFKWERERQLREVWFLITQPSYNSNLYPRNHNLPWSERGWQPK